VDEEYDIRQFRALVKATRLALSLMSTMMVQIANVEDSVNVIVRINPRLLSIPGKSYKGYFRDRNGSAHCHC